MEKTLNELADFVGGTIIGDGSVKIKGVMTIEDAAEGYITFISNKKYEKKLVSTNASAVIVGPHINKVDKPLLVIENPYLAFAKIVDMMMNQRPVYPKTIDAAARIGVGVKLGDGVTIFFNVFVGDNTAIGDNVTIYPGVYVGEDCEIGPSTVIYPNAVIYKGCKIGNRATIHSNAVIGSPGFGYAPDGDQFYNIPHVGIVVIEDNVVIEPNTTVSRSALGETRIKRGAKIGANVVIAHSVEIGENTLIVSQSGVAGSTKIGKNVTIAGQAGVSGHLKVGDNSIIGGRSGVTHNLPANGTYLGSPALPIEKMRKCYAVFNQLPEMRNTIKSLKERIDKIENKSKDKK